MNVSKTQLYSTETFSYMMSELSSSHFLAGLRFVFQIQSQKTAGVDIIRFHNKLTGVVQSPIKAGVRVEAVLTSLYTAFLPISRRSRFKQC